jgi:hypothetical protein
MKKAPPNTPERGDRCKMRNPAHQDTGSVVKHDPDSDWVTVRWDNGDEQLCHRFELVRVDA